MCHICDDCAVCGKNNKKNPELLQEYFAIRKNTDKIQLIQKLVAELQGLDTKEIADKVETLRQINHSNFCKKDDELYG